MRWQRAIFSVELCIHRQHCAVNWIKVGKIIRHLRLPQFAVRQYTPAGGNIQVSVQIWEFYVKINITDSGKGIAEGRQGMTAQP